MHIILTKLRKNGASKLDQKKLEQLVDKKKMKEMQREVKVLEKRKAQMEKLYEKMCGKAYKRMVDEGSNDNSNLILRISLIKT